MFLHATYEGLCKSVRIVFGLFQLCGTIPGVDASRTFGGPRFPGSFTKSSLDQFPEDRRVVNFVSDQAEVFFALEKERRD